MKFTLIVLFLLFIFVSNIIPVDLLSIFDFMQFPWRVYLYITFFISIAVAYFVELVSQKKQIILIGSLIIITYVGYISSINAYYTEKYDRIYTTFPRYQIEHYFGEFLPKLANMDYITTNIDPYFINISNPIDLTYEKKITTFDIYFNQLDYTNTRLDIPLLYYKGYSAYLTSGDTTLMLPIQKSNNSLMSINLGENKEGIIHFYYQGTRIQKVSALISIWTGGLFILYMLLKKFNLLPKLFKRKV